MASGVTALARTAGAVCSQSRHGARSGRLPPSALLAPSKALRLEVSEHLAGTQRASRSRGAAPPHVRRRAGAGAARAESPHDVLGVPRSATEKQIKSAFRRLALKYHPDVNKAPDAEQQFMRVKAAYQALTEPATAAGARSSSSATGQRRQGSSSWGGASGSSGFDGTWWKQGPEDAFYSFDDFFRDLSADLEQRKKEGKTKSLWQELADLGEEFVDFLEKELQVEDGKGGAPSSSAAGSSGSNTSSQNQRSQASDRSNASASGYGASKAWGDVSQQWADDAVKKGKQVADEVEEELKRLKREMGL